MVIPEGDPPSARYGHCSTIYEGLFLIVFGGEDSGNKFDDFFMFNIKTKEWKHIIPNISPTGRSGCCMASYDKYIIVQGGKTDSSVTEEILILDMHTEELSVLNNFENHENAMIQNHKCWVEANRSDIINLIIATGEYSTGKPIENVMSLVFDLANIGHGIELNYQHKVSEGFRWASAGFIPLGKYFLVVGGSIWSMYASDKIFLVPYKENDNEPAIILSKAEIETNYYHRHDIEQYGRDIYVGFSGATYSNVVKKQYLLSHFYKMTPRDNEKQYIPCSSGTYGEDCEPCPPGTYKSNLGSDICTECPEGTYNTDKAATSLESCFPCHFGYYSNERGVALCKECEEGFYCPVGSLNQGEKKFYESVGSLQPLDYVAEVNDPFDGKVYYFVYFTGMILFLAYMFSSRFREKIIRIDYFSEKHATKIGQPVLKIRTSLGGLVTIVFAVFQIIYIAQAFTSYRTDNILESKSLVPAVTRTEIFSASKFEVITEFIHYPGECVGESNNTCNKHFYKTLQDVDGAHITCEKVDSSCIITFKCPDCILIGDPIISYSLCGFGSLASGIRIEASSTSSIPGYDSEESFYIGFSNGSVFRGHTKSEFFFEVTRSVRII